MVERKIEPTEPKDEQDQWLGFMRGLDLFPCSVVEVTRIVEKLQKLRSLYD